MNNEIAHPQPTTDLASLHGYIGLYLNRLSPHARARVVPEDNHVEISYPLDERLNCITIPEHLKGLLGQQVIDLLSHQFHTNLKRQIIAALLTE